MRTHKRLAWLRERLAFFVWYGCLVNFAQSVSSEAQIHQNYWFCSGMYLNLDQYSHSILTYNIKIFASMDMALYVHVAVLRTDIHIKWKTYHFPDHK